MARLRVISVQILAVVLLVSIIRLSWSHSSSVQQQAESPGPSAVAALQERMFDNRARVLVGALNLTGNYLSGPPQEDAAKEIKETFFNIDLQEDLKTGAEQLSQKRKTSVHLIKEAILSYFFGFDKEAKQILDLSRTPSEAEDRAVKLVVDRVTYSTAETEARAPAPLTEDDLNLLRERFGWFGSLLAISSPVDGIEVDQLRKETFSEAKHTALKFFGIGAVVVCALALSLVSSTAFLFLALLRRLKWRFEQPALNAEYLLEIFVLYLALMLAPGYLAKHLPRFAPELNPLTISALGICLSLGCLIWPIFFRQRAATVFRSVGLRFDGLKKLAADLALGPTAYIAASLPIVLILSVYSVVLVRNSIDISQGTHPIVPIMMEDATSAFMIWILAVAIAPIVEEIMFRGALYGWLRSILPAYGAILVSSLIFAVVHPQGLLGIIPLMSIGIVLALLREWRGSLFSSMLAHASFNAGTLLLLSAFL